MTVVYFLLYSSTLKSELHESNYEVKELKVSALPFSSQEFTVLFFKMKFSKGPQLDQVQKVILPYSIEITVKTELLSLEFFPALPPLLGDSTVIHSARKQPFPSKLLNEPHTFPCSNHTQAKCTKTTQREGSIHHGQELYRHRQEGSWGEAGLRFFSSRKELAVGLPFQQEHKKWVSEWTDMIPAPCFRQELISNRQQEEEGF